MHRASEQTTANPANSTPSSAEVTMAGPPTHRQMFDRESLATYLRLSTDTIDRLVKAGRLPCVRIGSQVRFTSHDVDAFIEQHRQGSAVAR